MNKSVLLDTHILFWLVSDDLALSIKMKEKLRDIAETHFLFISAISIWEIALLEKKKKISLNMPIDRWVDKILSFPYFKIIELDHKISIESVNLPWDFHQDPADSILVATSRIFDIPIMTKDQKIIDYAKRGHVKIINCD